MDTEGREGKGGWAYVPTPRDRKIGEIAACLITHQTSRRMSRQAIYYNARPLISRFSARRRENEQQRELARARGLPSPRPNIWTQLYAG